MQRSDSQVNIIVSVSVVLRGSEFFDVHLVSEYVVPSAIIAVAASDVAVLACMASLLEHERKYQLGRRRRLREYMAKFVFSF